MTPWPRLAALALFILGAPAAADDKPYFSGNGWFVYDEPKSCVLYTDTPSGTMVRFSDRQDEGRLYFLVVNSAWQMFRPRVGETLMLYVFFPHLNRGYGTAALIIENVDGRIGFSGADLPGDSILQALAAEKGMVMRALFNGDKSTADVERLDTTGAASAVSKLGDCSLEHFPEMVE